MYYHSGKPSCTYMSRFILHCIKMYYLPEDIHCLWRLLNFLSEQTTKSKRKGEAIVFQIAVRRLRAGSEIFLKFWLKVMRDATSQKNSVTSRYAISVASVFGNETYCKYHQLINQSPWGAASKIFIHSSEAVFYVLQATHRILPQSYE